MEKIKSEHTEFMQIGAITYGGKEFKAFVPEKLWINAHNNHKRRWQSGVSEHGLCAASLYHIDLLFDYIHNLPDFPHPDHVIQVKKY